MTTPTSLRIPDELKNRYAELAASTQRTPHWLMLKALNEFIDRQEKRMAFIREGIESEKEYRRTGMHITLDECIDWLDSWGTDHEKATPACHK